MSRSLFSLEVEVTRWLVGPNIPPPGYNQGPCVQYLSWPEVSPELAKPTRQRVRQRASRQLSFMVWVASCSGVRLGGWNLQLQLKEKAPCSPGLREVLCFSLLRIRSTLGQRCWLQELDFLPGGNANVLGWILPGHWANPLGWCFCSIWKVFPSFIYCRLESLWPCTKMGLFGDLSFPVCKTGGLDYVVPESPAQLFSILLLFVPIQSLPASVSTSQEREHSSLFIGLFISLWDNEFIVSYILSWAPQMVLMVKNLFANAVDIRELGSIPGSGRSPGGGHSGPLQYSCLKNPMDRGAWKAMIHRVSESWTQLKQLCYFSS